MITKHNFQILEGNEAVSIPTLFCISDDKSNEGIYVLQSDSKYNPCDYCEEIFYFLKQIDSSAESLFIDLRYYYGRYTDSWLWKCSFVEDKDGLFNDATYEDVLKISLTKNENKFLKEYLYNNVCNHEISMCI